MRVKIVPGIHGVVKRVISGGKFNQQVLVELVVMNDSDNPIPSGEVVTRHIKLKDNGLWYMALNHWTDPMEIGQVKHAK